MTQIRRSGLQESQGDRPSLGHPYDPASDQELVGRTSASASGRALVPTTPSRASEGYAVGQSPPATFLAQLIATALKAPQTRARRRAEPGDASAVYATASAGCAHLGGTLYRSM
jgi:hypothetical protein